MTKNTVQNRDDVMHLQELVSHLQDDIQKLGDELFQQQKDMQALLLKIAKLEAKLQAAHMDSGILNPAEDTPPPHY